MERSSAARSTFEALLARLAADRDVAAAEYSLLARRLAEFFAWRGVVDCEALADEVLDRVASKVAAGEQILHLRGFAYGVARRVLLEWRRQELRRRSSEPELRARLSTPPDGDRVERQLALLERLLADLPEESRELILTYYRGDGSRASSARRGLAAGLGMSYNALKTRAHRIRFTLARRLGNPLAIEA